jgi:hypothetical protein
MTRSLAFLMFGLSLIVASADEFDFFSSSSQSRAASQLTPSGLSLDLQRVPLIDALELLGKTYDLEVLVDAATIDQLAGTVTAKGTGLDRDQAIARVLQSQRLSHVVDGRRLVVAAKRLAKADLSGGKLVSLAGLATGQSLQKRVPLMLMHTPLEMALQMVQGFSGIEIQIDRQSLRRAGIDTMEPVSVPGGSKTVAESLDAMLSPLGLGYSIGDRGIVITAKPKVTTPARGAQRV